MKILAPLGICLLFLLPAAASSDNLGPPAVNAFAGRPEPIRFQDDSAPAFIYREIPLGTATDEVRKKLGDPKDKSDAQDLYTFGSDESAQFLYGPDKKVRAIMVTFTGKLNDAPTPKQVFGVDVQAKPDGGIFKMVRYTKAGFWISYNKIVGDDSIVSIAMQKI